MKQILILCALLSLPAFGKINLSVVGTVNKEIPNVTKSGSPLQLGSGSLGFGFGGLMGVTMNSLLSLESGLLLINRKETVGSESLSFGRLQVPLMVRVTALPIVSFGAGPYLEIPFGDIGIEKSGVKSNQSYESQGFKSTDFGGAVSVGADLPVAPLMSLTADLRYCLGFTDYDKLDADTRKWGGFLFSAGLKLEL